MSSFSTMELVRQNQNLFVDIFDSLIASTYSALTACPQSCCAGEWDLRQAGVTAIAHPASMEVATTHGVFVLEGVKDVIDRYRKSELRKNVCLCFEAVAFQTLTSLLPWGVQGCFSTSHPRRKWKSQEP